MPSPIAIQIKMACAALGWSVRDLARPAGINANTVSRIENGAEAISGRLDEVGRVLNDAGVVFLAPGEDRRDGYGVRILPSVDGWIIDLDRGLVWNERAEISYRRLQEGGYSDAFVQPKTDNLTKSESRKLVAESKAAIQKQLQSRQGRGRVDPATKIARLREALIEGERSGRATDSSMESLLHDLNARSKKSS